MAGRDESAAVHEDTRLIEDALAYVTALYRELSQENGAPMLGTQNQVVDFILDDAELRNYVRAWAAAGKRDEVCPGPPERLPRDPSYERIRAHMRSIMDTPPFVRREREGR